MEYFTETNSWESAHAQEQRHREQQLGRHDHYDIISDETAQDTDRHIASVNSNLELFEADLQEKIHMDESLQGQIEGHIAEHMPEHIPEGMNGAINDAMAEQYFSPSMSFHHTPLMSPHALAPQAPQPPQESHHQQYSFAHHTPQGTPHGTPQMRPHSGAPIYSPTTTSSNAAATGGTGSASTGSVSTGSVTEYGLYYAPKVRTSSGKVTKQSPAMRWRSGSIPEDEFRLGDPALEMLDSSSISPEAAQAQAQAQSQKDATHILRRHSSHAGEELEERLRDAIAATAKANSRSNSASSANHSSTSRRASAASSNRTTPRIRPKVQAQSSAEMSPSVRPYDPGDSTGSVPDELFLKSNYQNLMDGTHQHLGLSAADRIATDLRSKKTVHKIAEQERRNRMNSAITELAQILDPEDEKFQASKAATVERATRYIRKLQKRIHELEAQVKGEAPGTGTEASPASEVSGSSSGLGSVSPNRQDY